MAGHDFLDDSLDELRDVCAGCHDDLNDARADLSEAEDRYQAAERDLGLMQSVVFKVTGGPLSPFGDGAVWPVAEGSVDMADGGTGFTITEDEADAVNRALDSCS